MSATTTRTLDPATAADAPDLHPVVRRVLRQLVRNRAELGGWDRITVEARPFQVLSWKRPQTWYTIKAEKDAATLAATYVQTYVRTSGPLRARFCGGYVSRLFAGDKRITTWADLRRAY